jgi:hypothetical protein
VVDHENVARSKYVKLGQLVDGLRVVAGLGPDDRVIVNGLMRAGPGVEVTPLNAADTAASDAVAKTQTTAN